MDIIIAILTLFVIGLMVKILMLLSEMKNFSEASNHNATNEQPNESTPLKSYEKYQRSENQLKGYAFERWVVEHFNADWFKISEWRGDKIAYNGESKIYPQSNEDPDLLFELQKVKEQFAVECKFRAERKFAEIEDEDIKRYKEYARNRCIPTFLIIGVGGEPTCPKDVYVIKLDEKDDKNETKHIDDYKRAKPDAKFRYDPEKKDLRLSNGNL